VKRSLSPLGQTKALQAKAPAPLKVKPLSANVGQTPIFSRLLKKRGVGDSFTLANARGSESALQFLAANERE
jgi:hypothetical protein